jgi:hypothetical protein
MRTLVKRISLQSTICRMVPAGDHRENRPPLRITIFVVRSSVLQVFLGCIHGLSYKVVVTSLSPRRLE